jgi:tyrosyl-tRNA synthetase
LRRFTLLGREEIEALERAHAASPEKRVAQRALASHMTERLHGTAERRRVEAASEALFEGGALESLDEATLLEMAAELPHSDHDVALLAKDGLPLLDLLPATTLASSRREAREFLEKGAITLNGRRVGAGHRISGRDLLPGSVAFLRRGKRSWHAVRWSSQQIAPRG